MKVLVATDGSEHSMKAVQRGLELAETQGAQVTLMSVAYYIRGYLEACRRTSRTSWKTKPGRR